MDQSTNNKETETTPPPSKFSRGEKEDFGSMTFHSIWLANMMIWEDNAGHDNLGKRRTLMGAKKTPPITADELRERIFMLHLQKTDKRLKIHYYHRFLQVAIPRVDVEFIPRLIEDWKNRGFKVEELSGYFDQSDELDFENFLLKFIENSATGKYRLIELKW
jgi:hypothetical protein